VGRLSRLVRFLAWLKREERRLECDLRARRWVSEWSRKRLRKRRVLGMSEIWGRLWECDWNHLIKERSLRCLGEKEGFLVLVLVMVLVDIVKVFV